jgi:hypothetical protein
MRQAGTVLPDTDILVPSWPGLTRPSTPSDEVLVQSSCGNVRLDGRVKPGHDVTTYTCPNAAVG